jgi:pimeloyl-ACP methyl ester carboxylesterase
MPFVPNDGIDIYYEVHGAGKPLVLLHGFAAKSFQWHFCGYVEELKESHQLVLIDLRGHGQSGKPHVRAAYSLQKILADIRAVLDALAIRRAHFMGYSMGGWLAYGMAVHHGEMVDSLIIGGAHPYAESLASFDGIDGSDADAFIRALEQFVGESMTSQTRMVILQNDLVALAASANERIGFAAELGHVTQPVLMFAGELDQRLKLMQQAATVLNCRKPITMPGATHASALSAGRTLLPFMREFLETVYL